MIHLEIQAGTMTTDRFGDRVRVPIPKGGRVELRPAPEHVDVRVLEKSGSVHRSFRLPKEEDR